MNCNPLCKYVNGRLRRFHLTCLTCPIRRSHYGLYKQGEYVRKKRLFVTCESPREEGNPMPRKYVAYFILMNADSRTLKARSVIVKNLLSLAEFFAQL